MLIVTNFARFPERFVISSGEEVCSIYAGTAKQFLSHRKKPTAMFVVNGDLQLTYRLAAESLVPHRMSPPLVCVDPVLRRPSDISGLLLLPLRRFLLSRVEHFIHYFQDTTGLERIYGIGANRSSYVPFKVNLSCRPLEPQADGEYVLCFGRSMRDFDTFLAAMETLPYLGAITRPDWEALATHGSRFTRSTHEIPPNIRLLDYDPTEETEIRILRNAKFIVIPILKASLVASGISTCLNSLWLGKCVIGSEVIGMLDVFTGGEILTVAPEDPLALAAMIRRVWEDDHLRLGTAVAGHAYALESGGEKELYARIVEHLAACWQLQKGPATTR